MNTETSEFIPRGRENILLVDDEEAIVFLVQRILQGLGYRVASFSNPKKALTVFSGEPETFDLVITDMTMPGMSGAELVRRLRGVRSDIPVILCTGFSEAVDEEKAKALGVEDFLLKPMNRKELARAVRKVLDREP